MSGGNFLPDLLPLPYTEEALQVVCRNVGQVQEALGRKILVENPSTYLQFAASAIPEADFLAAVAKSTGCAVLFDVNNVFVSASNQGLESTEVLGQWCRALDPSSVGEIHLAGHALVGSDEPQLRIDDHGDHVCDAVWSMYERSIAHFGPRPTLIEWDTRLPALPVLVSEAALAQERLDRREQISYARAG